MFKTEPLQAVYKEECFMATNEPFWQIDLLLCASVYVLKK